MFSRFKLQHAVEQLKTFLAVLINTFEIVSRVSTKVTRRLPRRERNLKSPRHARRSVEVPLSTNALETRVTPAS